MKDALLMRLRAHVPDLSPGANEDAVAAAVLAKLDAQAPSQPQPERTADTAALQPSEPPDAPQLAGDNYTPAGDAGARRNPRPNR